jgi:hypothetical protein
MMEAEDQTISVASSFAGYQEGKCQLSILLHFFFLTCLDILTIN